METFELRYFLGVARHENIHRASEQLNVSPGSLSKAIGRLEAELSVTLFIRKGRNIEITDHGRLLQKRAAEIIRIEEATKLELSGEHGTIQVVIVGPEILLSEMGVSLTNDIQKLYPKTFFEFRSVSDQDAIDQVARGEAHLGLVTSEVSSGKGLSSKVISEPYFQTFVGSGHPLHRFAKTGKAVPVEKVLEHSFVSPTNPLLGSVGAKQSLDGWRDDQFPRKVSYLTSSLKLLEELLVGGQAIAYLPDYFGNKLSAEILKVSGCPYSCQQKVRLVAKNPKDVSWLNRLF